MALVIRQTFPLGRFHATRWNQNPFEDPFGEWPPSPWRFLRALAARWFQYQREAGESASGARDRLLGALAASVPRFYLPPDTWCGPTLKQYQPTALEPQYKYRKDPKTKKNVLDYQFRAVSTTLVEDHYRLVAPRESVFWLWDSCALDEQHVVLLDQLLARMLYFGRAESFCRMDRVVSPLTAPEPNCLLVPRDTGDRSPVLVQDPNAELNLAALLDFTDGKHLSGKPIPPGTAWFYAAVPERSVRKEPPRSRGRDRTPLNCLQFAIGGRVYPPLEHLVKLTERFRGRVLRMWCRRVTGAADATYEGLTVHQKNALALMSGKDANGRALPGHRHAYYLVWPDELGLPTRLMVWRPDAPFTVDEIEAMLTAATSPISWQSGAPDWSVRVVALPSATPPPLGFAESARIWRSATPFVPPSGRHHFRKGGRLRLAESADRSLRRLLESAGYPSPARISIEPSKPLWLRLHETREQRRVRKESRTPLVRPGYRMRIEFAEPVSGPLVVGDSAHFGLGLFRAVAG